MTFEPKQQARTRWNIGNVVTFDIEAKDWTEPVALGMLEPDGTYHEFTGDNLISDFVDEVMRPKYRNMRFVAHNGGGYDFGFIIAELVRRDRNFDLLTKGNGDMFYIDVRDDHDKPRHFQDSFALMPRSLDSLSRSFLGKDEQKLDFDVDQINTQENMDDEHWNQMMNYLKRDCVALNKVLQEFTSIIEELSDGQCGCQLTMGSTTMSMYQTAFMEDEETSKIENCHKPGLEVNPEDCFRSSYYGGRTEVFRMNGNPDDFEDVDELYHYDVNSLYPTAYTKTRMPVGDVIHIGGDNKVLEKEDYGGVAYIQGIVPEDVDIPVLPSRVNPGKAEEKVVFPTGKVEGWYMLREIRYAMEVDALEDVDVQDSYLSKYGKPFQNYGESLYEMKQSIDSHENPGKYKVVKLLLNSFYGKFGMDREQGQIQKLEPEEMKETAYRPVSDGNMESLGIVEIPDQAESDYILPRIASAITSEARIMIHKWFMRTKDRGGRIWYCDTDSIVTDVELPEGEKLGEMDLEGKIEESYFLRPKTYAEKYTDEWPIDHLIKGKGMRNIGDFVQFDDFRKAFQENEPSRIRSEWTAPRGLKAGMKEDPEQVMMSTDYSRSLQGIDDKRDHTDDGKASKPLKVNEWN